VPLLLCDKMRESASRPGPSITPSPPEAPGAQPWAAAGTAGAPGSSLQNIFYFCEPASLCNYPSLAAFSVVW